MGRKGKGKEKGDKRIMEKRRSSEKEEKREKVKEEEKDNEFNLSARRIKLLYKRIIHRDEARTPFTI